MKAEVPPRRPLVSIPTYNERENLPRAVAGVHEHVPEAHVLVVDDASPDGTGELADELAAADDRVQVLHRPAKAGLGRAYLAAFEWALARDYDRILQMDADLSHDPRYLPALLATSEDADLVRGSRYVPGGGTEGWSRTRELVSRGGSLYSRTVLGVPVRDLTGGFKCYRRSALKTIDLSSVRCDGFGFQIEMTYRAVRAGLTVVEVPIVFAERAAGDSKMSAGIFLEALVRVWQIRLSA